jgi:iron(III) transport system substrate-binding protein
MLALAACTPPVAPQPTAAPKAAPTSAPKAEGAPAKPAEVPPTLASAPAAKPTTVAAQAQPTAASSATDSQRALDDARAKYYEAAKAEGSLVMYGTNFAPALIDPVREAFGKTFPGIEIRAEVQTGSITREKIIAEQLAKSYVVDIASTGFSTTRDLIDAGFVEPYESPQSSVLIPEFVHPSGRVTPHNAFLVSIAINTSLVPRDQEPKVWKDVLDPKWKGKLSNQDPRQPGGGGSIISGMAMVYGFDFLEQLKKQEPFFGPAPGPLWNGLIRGEQAMYMSASHAEAVTHRKSGAPVKYLKMQDGAAWTYTSLLNITNQPHPNAARLFIEWALSEEGQLAQSASGYGAVRKGIKAVEPEADMNGVVFLPRDSTPEADALIGTDQERSQRWDQIFFK